MRTAIAFLISLLAGTAFAQQDLKSYAPPPRTDAPVFINAEVVRVNLDNTATFRSESGEITLTAEPANVGILGSLRAGDKVLVEYREARTADGLRLTLKAREAVRIGAEQLRQYFDRNGSIQPRVLGLIHLSHAAGADERQNFVGAELFACFNSH